LPKYLCNFVWFKLKTACSVQFFSFCPVGIPSRPRSKPSSNPDRRINREWIPPVTSSKNESQAANSENEVQETNSVQRKQKRKKYKPKVVADKARSKKPTKSPGNSKSLTPDLKDTNAKAPTTPDLKPRCPRVPITPEPKLPNHEASIEYCTEPITTEIPASCEPKPTDLEASSACELKPATSEAPLSVDSMPQLKRVQNTPDTEYSNPDTHNTSNLTGTDSEAVVHHDLKPENIGFYNAANLKTEKLEAPVTPDPKSDLKPLNLPDSTQSFVKRKRGRPVKDKNTTKTNLNLEKSVRKKGGHPVNKDKNTTKTNLSLEKSVRKKRGRPVTKDKNTAETNPSLEKSSMGMQLNTDAVAKPTKSVRRQLNFDVEDYTELVNYEEAITASKPKPNNPIIAINLNSDYMIEQLQPLQEGLDSSPMTENGPVVHEDNTSATSLEGFIGNTTDLNCHDVVKPVPLVANAMHFELGDKTEADMHGEMHAGTDSKCLTEDIDLIDIKDHLIHLAAQHLRGVKRRRAKQSPKTNFNDMLEEIVLKLTHLKLYENALVLYQEKKKYRGIVALDEDSLIEWNILMGENTDGSKSAPGLNPGREEKWSKERDTFRNLAEWFIAKMKLIQGFIFPI
jgi:hypothetical protein